MTDLEILFLDIETSIPKVYTYGLWQQNISIANIIEHPRMIAFTAKWLGKKKIHAYSEYHQSRGEMLQEMWNLLDEADVVMGWNSRSFDIKWIQGEFAVEKMPPPSPFKQVDLMSEAKKNFRFLSNKLSYVSQRLLDDDKIDYNMAQMWIKVDNPATSEKDRKKEWDAMLKYACLTPDHKVLTTDLMWVEIGTLEIGDDIVGFDEEANQNGTFGRRVRASKVLGNRRDTRLVYEVTLSNGDKVKTTGDHQWLTRTTRSTFGRGGKKMTGGSTWTRTDKLIFNGVRVGGSKPTGRVSEDYCTRVDRYIRPSNPETSFDAGWLSGMLDGEGSASMRPGDKGQLGQTYVGGFSLSVTQVDGPVQDKLVTLSEKYYQGDVALYKREEEIDRKPIGSVLYNGGFWKQLDLLSRLRPERLISNLDWGRMPRLERGEAVYVVDVKPIGEQEIVILETSTSTYIADGYPMHNCKDTALLEPLFKELLPWIKMPHPMSSDDGMNCRNCGSTDLQRRGVATSQQGTYPRYQCKDCGSWSRGTTRTPVGETRSIS